MGKPGCGQEDARGHWSQTTHQLWSGLCLAAPARRWPNGSSAFRDICFRGRALPLLAVFIWVYLTPPIDSSRPCPLAGLA